MLTLQRIAVFCGANLGNSPVYADLAVQFADYLAASNISLVYGGACRGLMGVLADAMLAKQMDVIGVLPQFLKETEHTHHGITTLHTVNSMHERKALIYELSDAFVLFPGGVGSLDEFFEIITWGQLGLHQKPCGILNVNHFFDKLIEFLAHLTATGFIRQDLRDMILVADSPENLINQFKNYQPPAKLRFIKSTQQI